jgi:hypothetical protein
VNFAAVGAQARASDTCDLEFPQMRDKDCRTTSDMEKEKKRNSGYAASRIPSPVYSTKCETETCWGHWRHTKKKFMGKKGRERRFGENLSCHVSLVPCSLFKPLFPAFGELGFKLKMALQKD